MLVSRSRSSAHGVDDSVYDCCEQLTRVNNLFNGFVAATESTNSVKPEWPVVTSGQRLACPSLSGMPKPSHMLADSKTSAALYTNVTYSAGQPR